MTCEERRSSKSFGDSLALGVERLLQENAELRLRVLQLVDEVVRLRAAFVASLDDVE